MKTIHILILFSILFLVGCCGNVETIIYEIPQENKQAASDFMIKSAEDNGNVNWYLDEAKEIYGYPVRIIKKDGSIQVIPRPNESIDVTKTETASEKESVDEYELIKLKNEISSLKNRIEQLESKK